MSKRTICSLLAILVVAITLVATQGPPAFAKEGTFRNEYSALGVFKGGRTEAIEIVITRWTTDSERELLVHTLAVKGQNETVKELRDQDAVGFVTRRDGRDIQGMPSVRLHYAREFDVGGGKTMIVLITERPVGSFEALTTGMMSDANMSGIILNLEGKKGSGVVYRAMTVGFDDDHRIKIKGQAKEPMKLTTVERKK